MHRFVDYSAKMVRRNSSIFCIFLLLSLFSLFLSIFSDAGLSMHAATRSSLKNIQRYDNHHLNSHQLSATTFSPGRPIKTNSPDLTLTRASSPVTLSHGKHVIDYVLSVSNGHSAAPVSSGNTIIISNVIPIGVTDITVHARTSDWKVKLAAKTGPSLLTATYVGAYPIRAGTRLSPLIVHCILQKSQVHHLFLPAVVRLVHSDNLKKNSARLLQQQLAHDFTVQSVPSRPVRPLANPTYQVGQTIAYTLAITNDSAAGALITGDTITVTDAIPAGLTGLTASANSSDWTVSLAGTTSPTTLTATYVGTYPILPGAAFSPIVVVGTLTTTAVPQIVNTAIAVTPNDSNAANNSGTNTINVVPLPDLTVTDPVPSGTTFEAGKPITYTITGSNLSSAGPVPASDAITITDTIPAGLTGITATDSSGQWSLSLSATSGPATLTATYIGTYPVAAGTTFPPITITGTLTSAAVSSLANSATISTPKDSNAANNTASNSITVVPQPDLTLTKTTPASTTFQVAGTVTYTLTASNASGAGPVLTGDAITITDSIPIGLTAITASGTNWTVSLGATTSPTTLTATYTGAYPVNAGTSLPTITLSGTLTTASVPQVVNTATVTTPNDGNTANNSGSNTITVLTTPDLTVTDPVPGGTTFEVGKPVTYTVTGSSLSSAGPVLAGDPITITDSIPAGLTSITATDSSGKWNLSLSATSGPTTLTATYIGTYPVAAGTTLPPIIITGTLTSAAVSSLVNTATISTPKDSNAANNTASNTITVVVQPDLTLTKTAPTSTTFQVGGSVTYTLTASNASGVGPVLSGDTITITDSIPAGLTSMTASGTNWTVSLGATTSPTTLTATYTGAYPVAAGATLPAISLTGILTKSGLDISPSPVGYWPFDANTGTTAYDASSNHNNGTLTNGPTWTTGAINSALSFNGTSNYVTMGNASALQFGTGSFTASAWFKTTSTSGLGRIFSQGVGNYNGGFALDMNVPCAGCVAMVLGGNGTASTDVVAGTSTSFADGNWHQAAIVVNRTANTAQLYVDGVAQSLSSFYCGTPSGTTLNIASCTSLTANTTDPFVVGAYTGASGTLQYFNGSADEVRAYNSALSSAQIQTLYATPPLTNIAVVTTPNDGNVANNSGSSTISVLAAPDLTVTDPTPTGTTFEVGKPVTYTITGSSLSSAGPVLSGDAITITDTIPAGLTGITATDSTGKWNLSLSATSGPATLTATYIGTYPVAAGTAFPPITITGTLTSAAVSSLTNTATISTPKDSNAANNTASNTITVVPQPDLTITKTVPASTTFQVAGTVTYTLTASNISSAGPVLAGDAITITDSIPTGLTGLTASGTNWTISLSTTTSPSTLTATYTGSYPVNAGTSLPTITLSGTLTTSSTPQVINSATVTTPNDGNTANNSGSNTIAVATTPDLTVTDPTPPGTTFEVGKPVTYTITGSSLSSAGPVLSGDAITITDTIPAGLTGITATDSTGKWNLSLSATSGPATLTATYIGTYPVAAGTTLPPITITGTLTSAAVSSLANSATISTPKDSNAANNTASNTITVVVQPDLTITKTAPTSTTYQVGLPVTYTLTVSNASGVGPVLSGDAITITDLIPTGLTGLTASGTNWTVSLGATTSPTTLTATYTGTYPVAANTSLSTITLSGTLTTTSVPQVVNTATVTTPNDGNAANNSGSNTISVAATPDLTVTDPTPPGTTFEVGKPVTYTITGSSLSSAGPVLAGDAITLTDTIPAGLIGITATDSTGKWNLSLSATSGPATLTATYVGTYPVTAGTSLPAITITGTLTSAAVPNLANSATISTPKDSNAANNTASNTITVVVQPDLTMTKTVSSGVTFQVGKTATYTLTISNASGVGPVLTGDPITIVDTIPAGMTALTASGTNWTVSLSTTTSPSTLTATYTGTYPVAGGNSLPAITLTGTLTAASLSSNPMTSGYWPLDENSGTTAYDSSPNHSNGTLTGATWTTGKVNSGLSFNGTSSYVSMGNPAALQFGTGSFTTMAWFKTSATSPLARIVSQGLTNWGNGFVIDTNATCAGCVGGFIGTTTSTQANTVDFGTSTTFNDNNWHQAAMVVNRTANTVQMYVDGVAQPLSTVGGTCGTASGTTVNITSCTTLTASTTDPFTLGAYHSGSTTLNYFAGSVDEVRAYNSALSSAQLQTLYTIDTPPTPVGYWPFDANTGATAYDASSNHNNGTLTNGPTWTTGAINSALSFNGTSNYVTMGNPAALQLGTGSFTASAWFKTTNTSGLARIFSQGIGNYNGGFAIDANVPCSGCVALVLGGNGSSATTLVAGTSTSFADGNWHQVAMVINRTANTAQLYVDGVAQSLTSFFCGTASGTTVNIASCTNLTANTTDPFIVGAYIGVSGNIQYFNGSIDEVRVYGSALSSAQVYNLYNMPFTNTAAVTTPNDSNFTNNGAINKIQVILQPDLSTSKTVALSPTSSIRKQTRRHRLRSNLVARPMRRYT